MKFSEFLNEAKMPKFEGLYSRSAKDFKKITPNKLEQVKKAFPSNTALESLIKESDLYKDYYDTEDADIKPKSCRIYGFHKGEKDLIIYVPFVQSDYVTSKNIKSLGNGYEIDDIFYTEGRAIINVNEMKVIDIGRQEHNEYSKNLSSVQNNILGEKL